MKKFLLVTVFLITNYSYVYSESNVNPIIEGNVDAKIHLIIYESLTCSHCANFHEKVYPDFEKKLAFAVRPQTEIVCFAWCDGKSFWPRYAGACWASSRCR